MNRSSVSSVLSLRRLQPSEAFGIKQMAGYSSTPLWKKLGYKHGLDALVVGAPLSYESRLELPLETKVCWLATARPGMAFVHIFCRDAATLKRKLAQFRRQLASDGTIWVSWPKKTAGVKTNITEDIVRACALPLGLVDIKVCAVDEVWSGLKLMIRKTER